MYNICASIAGAQHQILSTVNVLSTYSVLYDIHRLFKLISNMSAYHPHVLMGCRGETEAEVDSLGSSLAEYSGCRPESILPAAQSNNFLSQISE